MLSMQPRTDAGCRTGDGCFESHRSSHQSSLLRKGCFVVPFEENFNFLASVTSLRFFLLTFLFFTLTSVRLKKKSINRRATTRHARRQDRHYRNITQHFLGTCATTRPSLPRHTSTTYLYLIWYPPFLVLNPDSDCCDTV